MNNFFFFKRYQANVTVQGKVMTSLESPSYKYLEVMRQLVARIPGCAASYGWSKTCLWRSLGSRGQNMPMVATPRMTRLPTFCGTMCSSLLERGLYRFGGHMPLFFTFIFLSDDTLQDITSHNFLYDEEGV
jgi:hypothetical protein